MLILLVVYLFLLHKVQIQQVHMEVLGSRYQVVSCIVQPHLQVQVEAILIIKVILTLKQYLQLQALAQAQVMRVDMDMTFLGDGLEIGQAGLLPLRQQVGLQHGIDLVEVQLQLEIIAIVHQLQHQQVFRLKAFGLFHPLLQFPPPHQ